MEAKPERHDEIRSKSVTMVTQESNSPIGGMSEEPQIDREMDMVEAGESSSMAGQRAGKTTPVSFIATTKQWKHMNNRKTLRNKTLEPVSTPGDCRS
jgi:hypothetical protein